MARVLHLFRAQRKLLPMEALPEVTVVANFGFEGCVHARPGSKRQALLVDSETLDAMNLEPGIIRENITTEGLNHKWTENRRATSDERRGVGSHRSVHALRSTGKSRARPLQGTTGQTRQIMPGHRRWNNSRWRSNRASFTGINRALNRDP
jgi:hypothetical protein